MGKERLLNSLQLMGGARYLDVPDYFHKSSSCDKDGRPVEKKVRERRAEKLLSSEEGEKWKHSSRGRSPDAYYLLRETCAACLNSKSCAPETMGPIMQQIIEPFQEPPPSTGWTASSTPEPAWRICRVSLLRLPKSRKGGQKVEKSWPALRKSIAALFQASRTTQRKKFPFAERIKVEKVQASICFQHAAIGCS
jgi:hypothetical protein